MATRGAKPKPAHLRLVDGTHRNTRHGKRDEVSAAVASESSIFGALQRPTYLKGEARKAWDRYITPMTWLDASREPSAILFCELWQEFRDAPRSFNATKHAQLRHLMSELGLTDERNRGQPDGGGEKDEFFD